MCYLRSVSEILLWCKSSSFSTKSSWCSLSVSTLPPDPFLPSCNLSSLLALLLSSPPPPTTSSSSRTSPNCSSPSRDWLLDRNWLRTETEAREQHMQSRKKTKQSMNIVNNKRKTNTHRDKVQLRSKADWLEITENRNEDLQQSAMQMNMFFALIWDNTQRDASNVFYVSVCCQIWTTFNLSLNKQSSIIWFQVFLKQIQTWTLHGEKMSHSAAGAFYSSSVTRCKLFQSWKRPNMATYMEIHVHSWGGCVHSW